MSKAIPDNPQNCNRTGHVPCVRIGFPTDSERPRQAPKLQSIYDPIPTGAETASPIYLLTTDEYERQSELENGWAIRGESSIANALQND